MIGCVVALLSGCPPPPAANNAPGGTGGSGGTGSALKLGHFASLTGATAMFGQSADKGVNLAVEEFERRRLTGRE